MNVNMNWLSVFVMMQCIFHPFVSECFLCVFNLSGGQDSRLLHLVKEDCNQ